MDKRTLTKMIINNEINYRLVRINCLNEAENHGVAPAKPYTLQTLKEEVERKEADLLAVETCPEEELQYYILNNL